MTLVVDASVLVAVLTDSGPDGEWAQSIIDAEELAGPALLLAESSNALRGLEFSRRIAADAVAIAYRDLLSVRVSLHPFTPYADRVWELRHNLTAYDAWYIAVAEALGCPLATLDQRLTHAPGLQCEVVTTEAP